MTIQTFIAYCTKGLEQIVREEIIEKILDAQIIEIDDKRVIFASNADYKTCTSLKTVDDLGLLISKIDDVEHFDPLLQQIVSLNFVDVKEIVQQYRAITENTFSLTVGSVGVKQFSAASLKQHMPQEIARKCNWEYLEIDHTNFDIRIFIDQDTAYVSIRLTPESLYVRSYKQQAKQGSLKPTIAAAMVTLSKGEGERVKGKDQKVVDNFCGSGTILCEAFNLGYWVYGGDIDAESVLITRNNLENLGFTDRDRIKHEDATATNWPDHFFDIAISNLPWDKQIPVKSMTNLYSGCLQEYRRIVKEDGTICLLVTKPELLIKYAKKIFPAAMITTIPISFQGQQPTMVRIRIHANV